MGLQFSLEQTILIMLHVTTNSGNFFTLYWLLVLILSFSYCYRRELEAEVSALRTKVETLEAKYVEIVFSFN